MPTKRLSRRTVLRGALATGAAVSVPLPILDIMLNNNGTAFAQGAPLPKRYCTWFFGNGIIPALWNPSATGTGSAWGLTEELAPLMPVKQWLTVVSGLKNMIGNASPHPMGSAASTTGGSVANNSAELASIDQIVAGVNKGGSFPSLEIGCSDATPNGPENTLHTCSHRGPNAPNYPEFDPHAAFTRMFMGVSTTGNVDQMMKLNQSKKSILDAVLADGTEVGSLLGAKDKSRLSDHLDAIRQIETRLAAMTTTMPPSVQIPPDPQTIGVTKDTKSEAPMKVNDVMAQMLAVALASGITKNATFMFTLPAAHVYYRSVASDMNADFHDTIAHTDAGNNAVTGYQTRYHKGVIYAMQGAQYLRQPVVEDDRGRGHGSRQHAHLRHVLHRVGQGPRHVGVAGPVARKGRWRAQGRPALPGGQRQPLVGAAHDREHLRRRFEDHRQGQRADEQRAFRAPGGLSSGRVRIYAADK